MDESEPGRHRAARRRPVRRVTADGLERAALAYLQRFAASEAALRRVLERRVERAARAHADTDRSEATRWIEELTARFRRAGLLDDRRFAETRVASLHRRGDSARAIRAKLARQGIAPELIAAALAERAPPTVDPELSAAAALARRRRLGPYRPAGERAERRERDLAALARAGFDYDVARRVIEATDPAALEDELGAEEEGGR